MKRWAGLLALVLAGSLLAGAQAQAGKARLKLSTAERVNKAYVRDIQCRQFGECVSFEATPCKRLSRKRVRCGGIVVYELKGTTIRCKTANYVGKTKGSPPRVYKPVGDCEEIAPLR